MRGGEGFVSVSFFSFLLVEPSSLPILMGNYHGAIFDEFAKDRGLGSAPQARNRFPFMGSFPFGENTHKDRKLNTGTNGNIATLETKHATRDWRWI